MMTTAKQQQYSVYIVDRHHIILTTDLLDEVNSRLEVKAKVDKVPINPFLSVFLLLFHKHVVVEELLQTFIGIVDAELLKGIHCEDLKTSNVKYPNEEILPCL